MVNAWSVYVPNTYIKHWNVPRCSGLQFWGTGVVKSIAARERPYVKYCKLLYWQYVQTAASNASLHWMVSLCLIELPDWHEYPLPRFHTRLWPIYCIKSAKWTVTYRNGHMYLREYEPLHSNTTVKMPMADYSTFLIASLGIRFEWQTQHIVCLTLTKNVKVHGPITYSVANLLFVIEMLYVQRRVSENWIMSTGNL